MSTPPLRRFHVNELMRPPTEAEKAELLAFVRDADGDGNATMLCRRALLQADLARELGDIAVECECGNRDEVPLRSLSCECTMECGQRMRIRK